MAQESTRAPAIGQPAGNAPRPADETKVDERRGEGGRAGRERNRDPAESADSFPTASSGSRGNREQPESDAGKPPSSRTAEQLESNAQELLDNNDGDRPDRDSGLELPPGLSGGPDNSSDVLQQACEALGECAGADKGG